MPAVRELTVRQIAAAQKRLARWGHVERGPDNRARRGRPSHTYRITDEGIGWLTDLMEGPADKLDVLWSSTSVQVLAVMAVIAAEELGYDEGEAE